MTRPTPPLNPPTPPESDRARALFVLALVLAVMTVVALFVRWRTAPIIPAGEPPRVRIAVNHADRETLELLPGVGVSVAQRILAERAARGPFRDTDDLQRRVNGIGPKLAARIDPHVTYD